MGEHTSSALAARQVYATSGEVRILGHRGLAVNVLTAEAEPSTSRKRSRPEAREMLGVVETLF